MPHLHRFFLETIPSNENQILSLTGQEAHHALHVVRVRVGDTIEVFNGKGYEWGATVTATTRHDIHIEQNYRREIPAPTVSLTLFQAWLHRDKAVEELIRHGAEIGIAKFVFFRSQHSERAPRVNDKWRRTAIEACKQCRRAWLPEFETTESLDTALDMSVGPVLVATRDIPPAALSSTLETINKVSLFVGPEGDFSEQEIESFRLHGAVAISLGDVTYRSEVAAVLASTLIQYELGHLGPREQH